MNGKVVKIIVCCKEYKEKQKTFESYGKIKHKLPMINSYVVEINEDKLKHIKELQGVISLEMDTHITAQMNRVSKIIEGDFAYRRGIYGKGIGVAFIDTGISHHRDFIDGNKSRIVAFKDFVNQKNEPYDDNGHGTHIGGILGGSGFSSRNRYMGVAPACNLIPVKVLDHKGDGNISDVLAGLQWIIDHKEKYNIRIVNISVGTPSKDNDDEKSLLVLGVNALWDSGLVVVVAAGNNGPNPKSISTPGISRKVITVGSFDDDIQVRVSGGKAKDYSGRGPTHSCIKKPDIVAPGSNIISCCGKTDVNHKHFTPQYTIKSGTSMATPIVSGAVALLLSAYPYYTNKDVKIKLKESARDIGQSREKQGWGLLNVRRLLE